MITKTLILINEKEIEILFMYELHLDYARYYLLLSLSKLIMLLYLKYGSIKETKVFLCLIYIIYNKNESFFRANITFSFLTFFVRFYQILIITFYFKFFMYKSLVDLIICIFSHVYFHCFIASWRFFLFCF